VRGLTVYPKYHYRLEKRAQFGTYLELVLQKMQMEMILKGSSTEILIFMAKGGGEVEGGRVFTSYRKNYSRTKQDVWLRAPVFFILQNKIRNVVDKAFN